MGSCSIAQQQLALLLLLLDELKPPQSCWVYDPVLTEQERAAIGKSGCALFTTNDVRLISAPSCNHSCPCKWLHAKCNGNIHTIHRTTYNKLYTALQMCKYTTKECTLFYMPHCGIAMYNNLLWANWDHSILSKIAIIGNRFSSYNER